MAKIAPGDNTCYCINLRRAANTITKYYDQAFAPLNLTTNQFSLLNDIRLLKSCNKSELAAYARLDRTTIIRSLNILLQKNLIEEFPGETNRNKVVQLTEAGKTLVTEGLDIWEQVQDKFELIIGEENKSALEQLLANIQLLES